MITELEKFLKKYNIAYENKNGKITVGGSLDLRDTNITSLPDNLTVGGSLYLAGTNITSLPDNLTVGGSLYLRDTNITSLPDNLTVGGYLYLRDTNITKPRKIKRPGKTFENWYKNLKLKIKLTLNLDAKLSWQNGKYRKIDNIFCEVVKQRQNIMQVKINYKTAFIFHKDGIYAHGKTVKQAYYDWLFKTSDRDVSKYEGIRLGEVHDLEFWVIAYRTITGACSFGTNNYLENNKEKYKKEMTLEEVFKATEGQYGSGTFKEFFKRA